MWYKKILLLLVALGLIICCTACSNETAESDQNQNYNIDKTDNNDSQVTDDCLTGLHHAEITIAGYGTIKLELDADAAPITVTNFVDLAQAGFYDGLTFHRIIADSLVQGGDPEANGTGGSQDQIFGEFELNGYTNTITHERGVVSMARSNDYDSASSQFFILLTDRFDLDGSYAAFGHVTEGMDIIDLMASENNSDSMQGLVDKASQPVIEKITIID